MPVARFPFPGQMGVSMGDNFEAILGALGVAVDKPRRLYLKNPKFGGIVTDAEGTQAYVDLVSIDSERALKWAHDLAVEKIERAEKGENARALLSEAEKTDARRLANVTVGWRLMMLAKDADGYLIDKPALPIEAPFSTDLATAVYLRNDCVWIRDQVTLHLNKRTNFI